MSNTRLCRHMAQRLLDQKSNLQGSSCMEYRIFQNEITQQIVFFIQSVGPWLILHISFGENFYCIFISLEAKLTDGNILWYMTTQSKPVPKNNIKLGKTKLSENLRLNLLRRKEQSRTRKQPKEDGKS